MNAGHMASFRSGTGRHPVSPPGAGPGMQLDEPGRAGARDTAIWPRLSVILKHPDGDIDRTFSDGSVETLARLILSCHAGEPAELLVLVTDTQVGWHATWALFQAIARLLAMAGSIARSWPISGLAHRSVAPKSATISRIAGLLRLCALMARS